MIRRLLFTVLATAMLAACSESEGGQTPQSTLTPPSDVAAERIGDTKVRVTWHDIHQMLRSTFIYYVTSK